MTVSLQASCRALGHYFYSRFPRTLYFLTFLNYYCLHFATLDLELNQSFTSSSSQPAKLIPLKIYVFFQQQLGPKFFFLILLLSSGWFLVLFTVSVFLCFSISHSSHSPALSVDDLAFYLGGSWAWTPSPLPSMSAFSISIQIFLPVSKEQMSWLLCKENLALPLI